MTIQGIARDQLVHSISDTVRKITESRGKKNENMHFNENWSKSGRSSSSYAIKHLREIMPFTFSVNINSAHSITLKFLNNSGKKLL